MVEEDELRSIGFFEWDSNWPGMEKSIVRFKLFENFKGVFIRIIVSKYKDIFVVDHIYFDSPKSNELQLELFGSDLSLENIVNKLKIYKENIDSSENLPETF